MARLKLSDFDGDGLVDMLMIGFAPSNSEARRLVRQGAVRFADQKITDPTIEVRIEGEPMLKVGKRRVCQVAVRED